MTISIEVGIEDIASELCSEPEQFLDLLTYVVDTNSPYGLESLIKAIASAHSGSTSHEGVSPFLIRLAEALVRREAE